MLYVDWAGKHHFIAFRYDMSFEGYMQHPLLLGTSINTKNALDARLIESAILHGPLQLHGCENDANGEDLITKVSVIFSLNFDSMLSFP